MVTERAESLQHVTQIQSSAACTCTRATPFVSLVSLAYGPRNPHAFMLGDTHTPDIGDGYVTWLKTLPSRRSARLLVWDHGYTMKRRARNFAEGSMVGQQIRIRPRAKAWPTQNRAARNTEGCAIPIATQGNHRPKTERRMYREEGQHRHTTNESRTTTQREREGWERKGANDMRTYTAL